MRVVTASPRYSLPASVETVIRERLRFFGFSLENPKPLADAIRALSNLFIRGGASLGYWKAPAMRAAYTAYFLPLNYLRARAVCDEAKKMFYFDHARVIEDWGCGLGSASWAALLALEPQKAVRLLGFDQSQEALDEFNIWAERLTALHGTWPGRFSISSRIRELDEMDASQADTFILSYVLNEAEERPVIPSSAERLILIEPSTHQAGRKLLEFRKDLLEVGWYAWAPCTHQYDCPLLVGSGRDWCHHRIHFEKPPWYEALEANLPMKNDTLTLSYVLLSKEPPPEKLNGLTRVIGDVQEEQGKSRQLICRGSQREFLSWLHRDEHQIELHRGDLLKADGLMPKGNESRVTSESSLEVIDLQESK